MAAAQVAVAKVVAVRVRGGRVVGVVKAEEAGVVAVRVGAMVAAAMAEAAMVMEEAVAMVVEAWVEAVTAVVVMAVGATGKDLVDFEATETVWKNIIHDACCTN